MAVFLERFLKKTKSDDITYEDFTQFLAQKVEEHQNLEYKSGLLLVNPDGSLKKPQRPGEMVGLLALARSVAGFANAEGGLLVLGVNELPEKYKGGVVRIRPGAISPLPIGVTRETIENFLLSKIQYPIEGLTIVPVRSSARSKRVVYLIDVPQSIRAPTSR